MHGTVMLTNRKGRKRRFRGTRPGAREVTVVELNPSTIAAAMPHRRALPEGVRHDQKAVSVVGRMCLFGCISDDMERAGNMFLGHFGGYMATADGPRSGAGTGRGFDCLAGPDCPDCECARRKARYLDALAALKTAGDTAVRAVFVVAIHDHECPFQWRTPLNWGLAALVKHYGLTSKGKRSSA